MPADDDKRTDARRWRHYHRILIDGIADDLFSEVVHTHEFTEGRTHEVTISRGYREVEQEV